MINQKWVFGSHAGLDFSSFPPTSPLASNAIDTREGCASICDANGQLLLYTDGRTVWDGTGVHGPITGAGLIGDPSATQAAIIVPDPGNNQRYYVFTAPVTGSNQPVGGRLIDVSNWTSVAVANMPLNTNPPRSSTERITAIQHANCVDFWVLTVVQNSPTPVANNAPGVFRLFLINSLGVQYLGETPMGVNVTDLGYLKGSPNGRRLALADWSNSLVRVYDFDNALGVINVATAVPITVPLQASFFPPIPPNPPHPRQAYGVEFSPNSNVLYYSVLGGGSGVGSENNGYIFQVDLTLPPASTQVFAYQNPAVSPPLSSFNYALGALQLGMDGVIYFAKESENTLGAILSPNMLGAGASGCNPQTTYITLKPGTLCNLGLPNLIANKCPCACEGGACDADIKTANQILNTRSGLKQFTLPANGQTSPTTCNLAFENVAFGPVFTLKWGDGPSDQFESEDFEVVYIRVHNPYRNLIYRNLIIFDITITPNQTLPSGEDSVTIIPAEIACFEEVQPCSFVARDFALVIDHALVGAYQISFKYCIEEISIVGGNHGDATFKIDVVAS